MYSDLCMYESHCSRYTTLSSRGRKQVGIFVPERLIGVFFHGKLLETLGSTSNVVGSPQVLVPFDETFSSEYEDHRPDSQS